MSQVTHSSGNHGQAVAWAANRVGLLSHVVVPSFAPDTKKDAIRGYGAHLVVCGPDLSERLAFLFLRLLF